RLHEEEQECLVVLVLDSRNSIRGYHEATRGLVNQSLGHAREIFRYAIINNASAIIMGHNHPSGCPDPSKRDIDLTLGIREAGAIIGIELMDHVIIGGDEYHSFKENELL
ncbi:MAG: JAB domain-containing protein, partial [Victivallales bacterium]|nr:JAB domain-containing protein [Victivallales bacterium]